MANEVLVASVNSSFEINPGALDKLNPVWSWLISQLLVTATRSHAVQQYLQAGNKANLVEEIIEAHQPDVLAVHEVIPSSTSPALKALEENHYVITRPVKLRRVRSKTVVGTRVPAEKLNLPWCGNNGSGHAFKLTEAPLGIIALHPSSLDAALRKKQIEHASHMAESIVAQGLPVIIMGDFNTKPEGFPPALTKLGFKRLELPEPTFPAPWLYELMQTPYWGILRSILMIRKSAKHFDHLLASGGVEVELVEQLNHPASDHTPFVAAIKY